jgi:hypothetical protein
MGDTIATADCKAVLVPRALLRTLLEAADLLAEHCLTMAETTPTVCGADLLDELVEIGVLDGDDLEVRPEFRQALHAGGLLLGGRAPHVPLPAAGTFGD